MIKMMLIAGLGGFIGTCLRFLVIRLCCNNISSSFPWGTFIVNIVGCLLIGILLGVIEKNNIISHSASIFLVTGICGSFTTFSTFSAEVYSFILAKEWVIFSVYISLSVILGVLCVWLGRRFVVDLC